MDAIIAHRHPPSRFSRLAGAARWLCERIPTYCPLCANRAVGGCLCHDCTDHVCATMRDSALRCQRCALRLAAEATQCPNCIALGPAYDRTIASFDYEAPADELIRLLKSSLRYNVTRALAVLLADAVITSDTLLTSNTLLIPVPSSLASLRRRGFNPAGEIARLLAPRLGLRLAGTALRRSGEGARQVTLGRRDRLRATHGLFYCVLPLQGAQVAIVDDVMTTGGTLDAAARTAGAVSVTALVSARAPATRLTGHARA
jgi:predicted amidophosphoribosyltransferase